ncbi:MAG: leucyl aminopeptidase [Pseudonocardiaceae bacterium]|nr:leucyl aminopeptidase [Pseudonocardiaceae bacterium]
MSSKGVFADVCTRELELCGVGEGQTVAVLSAGDERLEYADAFMSAAGRLGATPYNVRLPEASAASLDGGGGVGATPLTNNRPAVETLKRADLLVDLVFMLFSKEQLEIQEAGTRILLCIEPFENLVRLFPTADQRRRVEASAKLLEKASTFRFTNRAGTDVTYQLGQYPVLMEYGFTDQPGRWDHWPAGFLLTGGADDGVNGRVVVDRGDIITIPFMRYVQDPMEFTIGSGRIQDISGGFDAEMLRDYMASFDDDKAYGVAHIGWGCNEKSRWSQLGLEKENRGLHMESMACYGNVLFSTGPNQELGGTNDTQCHIDMPMRNCSVFLDEEPVLIDGEFVIDDLKAERNSFMPAPVR